jgi:hypothetical protein
MPETAEAEINPGPPVVNVDEDATWSPFPDADVAKFHADKDINQSQLHAELEQALNRVVQLSTTSTPGEIGETIWLVPGDVDEEAVQTVIDEHQADTNWGVPQSTQDYFEVLRRVLADPEVELTSQEIQTALKGLLLRQQP